MKIKLKLYVALLTVASLMISCGGSASQSLKYKTVKAQKLGYTVEIPSFLHERNEMGIISFTCEDPQVIGIISPSTKDDFEEKANDTSNRSDNLSYSTSISNDTLVVTHVSKGMFSAYELYLYKTVDGSGYLVNLSSSRYSLSDIQDIASRIANSIKKESVSVNDDKITTSRPQDSKLLQYVTAYYTIGYPKGWTVLENINEMTDAYIGSEKEDMGFTIVRFATDEGLATINKEGNTEFENAGGQIVSNIKTTINGQVCYKSVQELSVSGVRAKHVSYSFKKGTMFYNVKFGNVSSEARMKSAEQIINTFKIK